MQNYHLYRFYQYFYHSYVKYLWCYKKSYLFTTIYNLFVTFILLFYMASNMKALNTLLLLIGLTCGLYAQTAKNMVVSLPVEKYGQQMINPWAGGLNTPQLSPADLNRDGTPDLVAFDRVGDKFLTFLRTPGSTTDTGLIYAPQYEAYFPDSIDNWAILRDYNNDGIEDIFAHTSSGIKAYKGQLNNGIITWVKVSNLLVFRPGNFDINIYVNVDDVPAFVDVNKDGDLDILTFGIFGCSVEYFESLYMENLGNPAYAYDSLKFEQVTICWGQFCEDASTNALICNFTCKGEGGVGGLSEPAAPAVPETHTPNAGGAERHAGSTIFAMDYEDDNDVDVLLGDISFNNMVLALNSGDSSWAIACAYDSIFPLCDNPIDLAVYPAAYAYDVTGDGIDDMLVTPNAKQGARDVNNMLYYQKVPDPLCRYRYQSDTFLVADILDFGTDAKPVFFDFNNDGKLDIVVGNYGYFRPFQTVLSELALLDNIGSDTIPAYRLRSTNWQNLAQYNLVAISPTFGDLDGDGKQDMLIGDLNGFIHFFKNTGVSQASFPAMTTPNYFGLDVGQYCTPLLYDVNGDSLLDIVSGRRDGKLTYYWNFGTATSPAFHQDSINNNFGGVNVSVPGFTEGFSYPAIYRDSINQMRLLVGNDDGKLIEFLIDTNNLRSGFFTQVTANFMNYDFGGESTVSVADINNDGYLEYLCGNARGGIQMFSDSLWDTSTISEPVAIAEPAWGGMQLYPNPATNTFSCFIENADLNNAKIEVYNLLGERVSIPYRLQTNRVEFNTTDTQHGLYLVKISYRGITRIGKVLIQ